MHKKRYLYINKSIVMSNVINKELLGHLLKLELDQQQQVLEYVKHLLTGEQLHLRAASAEEDIAQGKVKSFDQFSEDFENWKAARRTATK